MKPSKYNFVFPYQFNKSYSVVYNTFKDTVGIVTSREAEFIKTCDKSLGIHGEKVKDFMEKGFVIQGNTNESAVLKVEYLKSKFDTKSLSLVIVPTYQCNLDCAYCYEKLSYGAVDTAIMTDQVQDEIVEWVKNNLEGVETLEVAWHGGEPLVALEVVKKLGSKLQALAKGKDVNYIGKMSTNGYLFTKDVAKTLKELGITEYKMSVDGCRENHNSKKKHKDGTETYDIIIDNLENAKEYYDFVDLRINVDKKDLDDAYEIMKILHGKKLCGKVVPRLGKPEKYSKKPNDENFTREEYVCEAINYSLVQGIGPHEFSRKDCYCQVEKVNSIIIDNHGTLFKCVYETGDGQNCGKLNKNGTMSYNKNFYESAAENPTTDIRCEKCRFLPICFGGCAYERKVNNQCSFGSLEKECWMHFLNAYVIKRLLNRLETKGFSKKAREGLSVDDLIMGKMGEKTEEFMDRASLMETTENLIALGHKYKIDLSIEDAQLLFQLMQPTGLVM